MPVLFANLITVKLLKLESFGKNGRELSLIGVDRSGKSANRDWLQASEELALESELSKQTEKVLLK